MQRPTHSAAQRYGNERNESYYDHTRPVSWRTEQASSSYRYGIYLACVGYKVIWFSYLVGCSVLGVGPLLCCSLPITQTIIYTSLSSYRYKRPSWDREGHDQEQRPVGVWEQPRPTPTAASSSNTVYEQQPSANGTYRERWQSDVCTQHHALEQRNRESRAKQDPWYQNVGSS
jgi:hypothetical protein